MRDIFETLLELKKKKLKFSMATIVAASGSTPRKAGARMIVLESGRQIGSIGGGAMERQVIMDCLSAIDGRGSMVKTFDMNETGSPMACGGRVKVFIEPFLPAPTLFIFGAGHIGKALLSLSTFCSMETVVIDKDEEKLDRAASHGKGVKTMCFAEFLSFLKESPFLPRDIIVIATGSHKDDIECVRTALETEAGFIGLLGSRNKKKAILDKLVLEGIKKERLGRIVSPVGLSIGARSPEEIAVSIMAQIIQHVRVPDKG